MRTSTSLQGLSVLVLEDDFYLAEDAREILESAGARVLGPFAAAEEALGHAAEADCALVDVNLGDGPDFEPAKGLLGAGVPVIFVTGYDHSVIPPALSDTPWLQKPTSAHRIIAAVEKACGR